MFNLENPSKIDFHCFSTNILLGSCARCKTSYSTGGQGSLKVYNRKNF